MLGKRHAEITVWRSVEKHVVTVGEGRGVQTGEKDNKLARIRTFLTVSLMNEA